MANSLAVEAVGKGGAIFFTVPLLDVDGCRFGVIAGGGGETITQVEGVWFGTGEGVGFGPRRQTGFGEAPVGG